MHNASASTHLPYIGLLAGALQRKPRSMSITYAIAPEHRLIRAYASGVIRAEDLHAFLDTLLADEGLVPGVRGLYDTRFAEPDITILELAEVAAQTTQLVRRGMRRIAIVAGSPNTLRVAKTFSILARALSIDVDVFTDLSAAESWLETERGDDAPGEKLLRP